MKKFELRTGYVLLLLLMCIEHSHIEMCVQMTGWRHNAEESKVCDSYGK